MRIKPGYSLLSQLLTGLLVTSMAGASEPKEELNTAQRVTQAAESFMEDFSSNQQSKGREVTYELGSVDDRLSLAPCGESLEVSFSGDPERSTRTTLLVSCPGDKPWRLFLNTEVEITVDGWVSAKPIGRGQRLEESMLKEEKVVINKRRRGGFKDPRDMLGMEAKRSINAGIPITPNMLVEPEAVERGDRVVISASSDVFSIETRGEALSSGRVGEQISVVNENSGRRVRGRITEPGHVTIGR